MYVFFFFFFISCICMVGINMIINIYKFKFLPFGFACNSTDVSSFTSSVELDFLVFVFSNIVSFAVYSI